MPDLEAIRAAAHEGQGDQRYLGRPLGMFRLSCGLCPECGQTEDEHTGWGAPKCSLTDYGVAGRLEQYRRDLELFKVLLAPDRKRLTQALGDPGSFLPRERWVKDGETEYERLIDWQARAVEHVLATTG